MKCEIFISQRWRASASRKAISLIRPLHVRFKAFLLALCESIKVCPTEETFHHHHKSPSSRLWAASRRKWLENIFLCEWEGQWLENVSAVSVRLAIDKHRGAWDGWNLLFQPPSPSMKETWKQVEELRRASRSKQATWEQAGIALKYIFEEMAREIESEITARHGVAWVQPEGSAADLFNNGLWVEAGGRQKHNHELCQTDNLRALVLHPKSELA
jgi:hypothetical protein